MVRLFYGSVGWKTIQREHNNSLFTADGGQRSVRDCYLALCACTGLGLKGGPHVAWMLQRARQPSPLIRRLWMFLSLDLSYPPTPRTCRILGNIPLSRSCVEPDLHRHGTVKDKPSCVLACFPVSLVRNPFNCIHPWFGNPVGKSRPDIEN